MTQIQIQLRPALPPADLHHILHGSGFESSAIWVGLLFPEFAPALTTVIKR